jgi:hypothetical protein
LKLDLAGAFAAYFLLFIGSYLVVNKLLFDKKQHYEVWTVKGTVEDHLGKRISQERNKPLVQVLPFTPFKNGRLDFQVSVDVEDGVYDFPEIDITAMTADQQNLFIGDDANDFLEMDIDKHGAKKVSNWEYDFRRNIITYKKPLKLTKEQMEDTSTYKIVSKGENSYDINPKQ